MELPSPDDLRASIEAFDPIERRILASMIVAMIEHSDRVRDKEWIAERFAHTATFALEIEAEYADDPAAGIERVQAYAKDHMPRILDAAYAVFAHTAQAMQSRTAGFSFRDAVEEAMTFVPKGTDA